MIESTRQAIELDTPGTTIENYDPAESYAPERKARLPLGSPLARVLREFYERENRAMDGTAMADANRITAYFCVSRDQRGNKIIGIRRAATFKSVLKSRLIRFLDDTLRAVEGDSFRLDTDFDVIVDGQYILINHMAGFEAVAAIDTFVVDAARSNIQAIERRMPFVDFAPIQRYVETHKRGARLIAAVQARSDLQDIVQQRLREECQANSITVEIVDGRIRPRDSGVLGFVQILDRRRYALSLVEGVTEQYEAASRKLAGTRRPANDMPIRPSDEERTATAGD